jgi:ATP adenylyltransferase
MGGVDHLWTPWRYAYVTEGDKMTRLGIPEELAAFPGDTGCVFCNILGAADYAIAHGMDPAAADRAALIIDRAEHNYICLNRYPYNAGHIMIVPREHQRSLAALAPATAREMMDLARRAECALASLYSPDGFNFGLNLGKSAGAGVTGHLHLHALPRWTGDTNFMTVVGETRVLPEDLATTWQRMRSAFASHASNTADGKQATR